MLEEWMPGFNGIDALHKFWAKDGVNGEEELGRSRKMLLVFGFLSAVLGSLLGALASAFRSSDVVGVLIWFLHRELENKTCWSASQEFLEKFTYTKVTSGRRSVPPLVTSVYTRLRRRRTSAEQMHDK